MNLKNVIKDRLLRVSGLEIVSEYINAYPTDKNALDIFEGDWASLPPSLTAKTGDHGLFNDDRIQWLVEQLGGSLKNMHMMECGPLEGGHTYLLEKAGAESILAIEGNTRCYLRCLVLKEILRTTRSRFMLGDFTVFLRENQRQFDMIVSSGVLYHLVDPVTTIAEIARTTDILYIWTHYYDHNIVQASAKLRMHFRGVRQAESAGFTHQLYRQHYQTRLGNTGFMGGSAAHSHWLTRNDLIDALHFFGFDEIVIGKEVLDAPAGPHICLLAKRKKDYKT